MHEVDQWTPGDPGRDLEPQGPARPARLRQPSGAIDRRREGGLDLTPEEIRARRSNRRWLLVITAVGVTILALALIATAVATDNEPKGPKAAAPAGYKAVRDSYWSYAVPAGWATNPTYTDSAGDVDTAGPDGWAAEHIAYRAGSPVLGEAPPSALRAFGMPAPTGFQLVDGHAIGVPGATAAFAYTMTRPGGFRAVVIDAWSDRTAVEIWLTVHAGPGVTAEVLRSFTG